MESQKLAQMLFRSPDDMIFAIQVFNPVQSRWVYETCISLYTLPTALKHARHMTQWQKARVVRVCRYIPYGWTEPIILKIEATLEINE